MEPNQLVAENAQIAYPVLTGEYRCWLMGLLRSAQY